MSRNNDTQAHQLQVPSIQDVHVRRDKTIRLPFWVSAYVIFCSIDALLYICFLSFYYYWCCYFCCCGCYCYAASMSTPINHNTWRSIDPKLCPWVFSFHACADFSNGMCGRCYQWENVRCCAVDIQPCKLEMSSTQLFSDSAESACLGPWVGLAEQFTHLALPCLKGYKCLDCTSIHGLCCVSNKCEGLQAWLSSWIQLQGEW